MSMELALIKTLLNKEFYDTNKVFARETVFRSKETKAIKRTLDEAMFKVFAPATGSESGDELP